MSELIDRAVAAIWPNAITHESQENRRRRVRAALAAIREPSREMVLSCKDNDNIPDWSGPDGVIQGIWRAMIDELLRD